MSHIAFKDIISEATVRNQDIDKASSNIIKYLSKTLDKQFHFVDGQQYANNSGTFLGFLYIADDNSAIRVNWEGNKFHSINFWNDWGTEVSAPSIEIFTGKNEPGKSSFARLLPDVAAAIKDGGFAKSEDDEFIEDDIEDDLQESVLNEEYEYNGKIYKTRVDVVYAMYDEGKSIDEIKTVVDYPPGHIRKLIAKHTGNKDISKSASGKVTVLGGKSEQLIPSKSAKKADAILDETEYADPDTVFSDLDAYVAMVGKEITAALLITGQGGIGKSYTVTNVLNQYGKKGEQYVIMKGHCTPAAMYKFLYNHYNQICVFDDCDSIFDSADGMNILKGALDSGNPREISWMTKGPDIVDTFGVESHEECEQILAAASAENKGREMIPSYFQFNGAVIFISNLTKQQIYKKDRAITTRCMCIDIVLKAKDVVKRIETVMPHIKVYDIRGNNIASPEGKREVMEWIKSDEFQKNPRMRGKEVNFRLFDQVFKLWYAKLPNWRDLSYRCGG